VYAKISLFSLLRSCFKLSIVGAEEEQMKATGGVRTEKRKEYVDVERR
jgi:hypothetical protein